MDNVFFVGAGASLPAPAGLPLFRHLWKAAEVGLNPGLRGRLQYLAPEPLFRALDLARVPVETVLLEIFNSATARPNAVHFVLARRLLDGDVVWTTNYDTLIEDALAALAPSTVAESAALENLRKPHGTFVRGASGEWERGENLVFKADQVVVAWPGELETLLEDDCTGRPLTLLGYSGIDVNTYPALRRAFRAASAVSWWVVKTNPSDPVTDITATTEFRFPEVDGSNIRESDNPSRDFVLNANAELGYSMVSSLPVAERTAEVLDPVFDSSRMTREVAQYETQAIIAREMGERRASSELFRESLRSGRRSGRQLVLMVKHSKPVQGLRSRGRALARWVPSWVPLTEGVKARAVTELPWRDHKQANALLSRIARWERGMKRPLYRARLLLAGASALRFSGRYEEALEKAETVRTIARREGSALPTEAARAEFEALEALRTMGEFDEALERVRARVHTLGMSHWGAWFDYELAALYLQLRDSERAERPLDRSLKFFSSTTTRSTAYDPLPGQRFTRLAHIARKRCEGNLDAAGNALADWKDEFALVSLPPLYVSLVRFNMAEVARGAGKWDDAFALYGEMDADIEIHGGLMGLGQAMASWGAGRHPEGALANAAGSFTQRRSLFGLAYCTVIAKEMGLVTPQVDGGLAPRLSGVIDRVFHGDRWPQNPSDQIIWA